MSSARDRLDDVKNGRDPLDDVKVAITNLQQGDKLATSIDSIVNKFDQVRIQCAPDWDATSDDQKARVDLEDALAKVKQIFDTKLAELLAQGPEEEIKSKIETAKLKTRGMVGKEAHNRDDVVNELQSMFGKLKRTAAPSSASMFAATKKEDDVPTTTDITLEQMTTDKIKINKSADGELVKLISELLEKVKEYGMLLGPAKSEGGKKVELRKKMDVVGNALFSGTIDSKGELALLADQIQSAFKTFVEGVDKSNGEKSLGAEKTIKAKFIGGADKTAIKIRNLYKERDEDFFNSVSSVSAKNKGPQ